MNVPVCFGKMDFQTCHMKGYCQKFNEKREAEMKPQRTQRKTLSTLWFILTLPMKEPGGHDEIL